MTEVTARIHTAADLPAGKPKLVVLGKLVVSVLATGSIPTEVDGFFKSDKNP